MNKIIKFALAAVIIVAAAYIIWKFWFETREGFATTTATSGTTTATSTATSGTTTATPTATSGTAATTTATSTATAAAPDTTTQLINQTIAHPTSFTYVEDITLLPLLSYLRVYISAFSDGLYYNNTLRPYDAYTQKWYNHVAPPNPTTLDDPIINLDNHNYFNVIASTIPVAITGIGLPLNNAKLVGARSDSFGTISYELAKFTLSLYIRVTTAPTSEVILFTLAAEAPNYIFVTLAPAADPTMVVIKATIGNATTGVYQATVPRDLVVSQQQSPTAITIAYDSVSALKQTVIYVGTAPNPVPISGAPSPIVLGNTSALINAGGGAFDATLHAFAYFTEFVAAPDVAKIVDYFTKQGSGYYRNLKEAELALAAKQAEVNDALKAAAAANAASSNIPSCSNIAVTQPVADPYNERWRINAKGGAGVDTSGFQNCSIHQISKYGGDAAKAKPAPGTAIINPVTTAQPAITSSNIASSSSNVSYELQRQQILGEDNGIRPVLPTSTLVEGFISKPSLWNTNSNTAGIVMSRTERFMNIGNNIAGMAGAVGYM